MLPEVLCRSHQSSSRLAWPLIPTCGSTVTRETLQRPATSTLELCAMCAVYWLTTSPRQSSAVSSLPGWTTAMHCWVEHRRRLSISYSTPRTTSPESSARAGVALTPGRCFTRYTGFQWGSGSPINWLYWLTRCGPQPLQRISASWYRPVHRLGVCALPMLWCSSFLAYTPNWPIALFLLLLHPPGTLYLLTFDCGKTF